MTINTKLPFAAVSLAALTVMTMTAFASGHHDRGSNRATLIGGEENPPVVSDGSGRFRAEFRHDNIKFRLKYDAQNGDSDAFAAHLHVANPGNNGGIAAFLCSNVGGPTTNECPPSPGRVKGRIFAEDVLQVEDPDTGTVILAGEDLDGLKRLIRQGAVYVNVHTPNNPGGEIRGQINPRER